jgi:hypothetical protein
MLCLCLCSESQLCDQGTLLKECGGAPSSRRSQMSSKLHWSLILSSPHSFLLTSPLSAEENALPLPSFSLEGVGTSSPFPSNTSPPPLPGKHSDPSEQLAYEPTYSAASAELQEAKTVLRQDSSPVVASPPELSAKGKRRDSDSSDVKSRSKSVAAAEDEIRTRSVRLNSLSNPLFRKPSSPAPSPAASASEPPTSIPVEDRTLPQPQPLKVGKLKQLSKDSPLGNLFGPKPTPAPEPDVSPAIPPAATVTTTTKAEQQSQSSEQDEDLSAPRVGKLKNLSKDSPLANLFGPKPELKTAATGEPSLTQESHKEVEPPAVPRVGKLKGLGKDNPLANLFGPKGGASPVPPLIPQQEEKQQQEEGLEQKEEVVGKLQKQKHLTDLFANRSLPPAAPPPLAASTPASSSLPLAVPNSSRAIPIPPDPPGYSPPLTQPQRQQPLTGPPLAVPASLRPIPTPPTPPFNPNDFLRSSSGPSSSVPPLPPMKKKTGTGAAAYASKHKPKCKMKGVFWSKLSSQQCSKSLFWSSISVKQLDHLEIDYSLLEESFGDLKQTSQAATAATAAATATQSEKPKTVTLFDSRRTQNILISLNKLKLSATEVVEMVTDLNPTVLTQERCDLLSTLVPSAEETKQLLSYANDLSVLGKAEQFLFHLQSISRLKERLECHKLLFSWNSTADSLTGEINIIHSACQELLANDCKSKLLTIFSVILAVGNFMNGGTSRVATGITLESIVKMSTVKVTKEVEKERQGPGAGAGTGTGTGGGAGVVVMKKSDSLLHYVVRQLEQEKYRETLSFHHNWKCVLTAADISFNQIALEMLRLERELGQIQSEMDQMERWKQQLLLSDSDTGTCPGTGTGTAAVTGGGTEGGMGLDQNMKLIEKAEDRFQPFLSQGRSLLKYIRTNFVSVESILKSTMEIFGETFVPSQGAAAEGGAGAGGGGGGGGAGEDKCQQFFKILCQVSSLFQSIEQQNQQTDLLRQRIAAKAAATARAKQQQQQSSRVAAQDQEQGKGEGVGEGDKVKENLFEDFRSKEEETPERIVELFRSKLPMRRASAHS